jgi:hypothetical protein
MKFHGPYFETVKCKVKKVVVVVVVVIVIIIVVIDQCV